jgi:hypothetical protein
MEQPLWGLFGQKAKQWPIGRVGKAHSPPLIKILLELQCRAIRGQNFYTRYSQAVLGPRAPPGPESIRSTHRGSYRAVNKNSQAFGVLGAALWYV